MNIIGGIPKILAFKANYFNNNYEVIFITANKDTSFFYPIDPSIKTYNLYQDSLDDSVFNIKKYRKKLEEILIAEKAHITITTAYSYEFPFLTKLKDESKKICEFHGTFNFAYGFINRKNDLKRYIFEKLFFLNVIRIARKYDEFVVLTKSDQQNWKKYLKNCTNISNPLPDISNKQSNCSNKNIIAAGRLDGVKGFTDLVHIWNLIEHKNPEWKLNIFGEGIMRGEIEKLISEYGLKNIHLMGSRENLESEYLNSSIHLVTSSFEGQSLVILEAMSYGLPTISYDIKVGPKELIKDNISGFLTPKGNWIEMSEKINKLIEDELLRKQMGQSAHQNSKNYQIENISKKWEALFSKLLNYSKN